MNVIVTGAAGFIGSHVTKRLLDDGHQVAGIDNFSSYYDPKRKEENIDTFVDNPAFSLHRCDITDAAALAPVFSSGAFDLVIHLAAQPGVRFSLAHPETTLAINVSGTLNVLEAARTHKIPRVIFASSSSVYGNGNTDDIPFAENDRADRPLSVYGASKRAGELLAASYHHLHGLDIVCLRLFNVYGPNGRPDMAPALFLNALLGDEPLSMFGDGSARRDFTYIDDICKGILACVPRQFGFEIINLGNAHPVTVNELVQTLEKITGKTARVERGAAVPGDVAATYADVRKAKALLAWEPTTSLEQGLRAFVSWNAQRKHHAL